MDSPIPKLIALALTLLAMGGLGVWWMFLGRKRLIQDTPTSAAKGVALGLNELIGTVDSSQTQVSPQGAVSCVWWKNEFYKKDREGNWTKKKERQGGPLSFLLEDESGTIAVRQRKAEVTAPKVYEGPYVSDSIAHDPNPTLATRHIAARVDQGERKVIERVIVPGDQVYVLGTAQLPNESLDVYIGPDRHGSDPFLIRVGSEDDAIFAERIGSIAGLIAAVAGAAAAGVALADGQAIQAGGFQWTDVDPVPPLLGLLIVLFVMSGLSAVFIYNGLIRLQQRAQVAWSLIDVQLRRRHDLIPNLVQVVKTYAEHESVVQASVAELRANLAGALPGEPSDDAVRTADAAIETETAALGRVMAVVEAYPMLTADESYAGLRTALVDTEDRVALAREFYNNAVQALHDRAQVFPGAVMAWIFELDLSERFLTAEQLDDQVDVGVRTGAGV